VSAQLECIFVGLFAQDVRLCSRCGECHCDQGNDCEQSSLHDIFLLANVERMRTCDELSCLNPSCTAPQVRPGQASPGFRLVAPTMLSWISQTANAHHDVLHGLHFSQEIKRSSVQISAGACA